MITNKLFVLERGYFLNNKYIHSFFVDTTTHWTNLHDDILVCTSIQYFTIVLDAHLYTTTYGPCFALRKPCIMTLHRIYAYMETNTEMCLTAISHLAERATM
jgi:hypothetical protein